jgi:dTDP-4-amino-4,6-dideoxygalactose transaminase
VIIPALTFAATVYAPIAAGALPVIVDVTRTRGRSIRSRRGRDHPRTRAIMPVHLGHQMADMDRIMGIAARTTSRSSKDCAHAHGQRWNDGAPAASVTSARSATNRRRS